VDDGLSTNFSNPVEITFYPFSFQNDISNKTICLASAPNLPNQQWECQDNQPTKQNGYISGKVWHFTSFGLLVGNNNGFVSSPLNRTTVITTVVIIGTVVIVLLVAGIIYEKRKRESSGISMKTLTKASRDSTINP